MIVWFSGTGNSRLVARRLSALLDQSMVELTVADPEGVAAADRVVWVFPIYSWGVPPVVRRFIGRCRFSVGQQHFMVCTCGDDTGLAHLMWRRCIGNAGGTPVATFSVQMPNNYTLLLGFDVDPVPVAQQKLMRAPERIAEVARAIRHSARVDDVVRGTVPGVKTRCIYPLFVRYEMSPSKFHHTAACVRCGKCSSACPMNNVGMTSGGPEWGDNCALCLACYHVCPVHAVMYGRRTAGKGQYMAPDHFPDQG